MWAGGAKLEALLDENGNVDAGKVTAAARCGRPARLELPKPPGHVPGEGRNARPVVNKSFTDAFKINNRVRGKLTVRWLHRARCSRHLAVAPGGHPLVGPGAPAFDPVYPS